MDEREERHRAEDIHDEELAAYLRRIGARNLASELNDLRFRNRIMEATRWLDAHDARVSYEEQLHDKIDQRLMGNQAILFDKSQAYMNFVVTLGYAGFFAIWNLIKDLMHPWDMKVVAILLGVSLIVFIAWTLTSMTFSTNSVRRLGNAVRAEANDRETRLDSMIEAEYENLRQGLKLQRLWLPTFSICVLTGFAAGLLLLTLLFFDVIGQPFSLYNVLFPSTAPTKHSGEEVWVFLMEAT